MLRSAIETLLPWLETCSQDPAVLHGAPHRLNVPSVGGEARFIDFETICVGPIEWDLAHLEDEVAAAYPAPADAESLRIARLLVSAKTAAWCWAADPANEEMRWHAEHHLRTVRRTGC
jgi:thiamine kinase-like enzyme